MIPSLARGWPGPALLIAASILAIRSAAAAPTPSELAGVWIGAATHDGESDTLALSIAASDDSTVSLSLSFPVVHLESLPLGRVPVRATGDSVRLGPFLLAYDPAAGTLAGILPRAFVPVYAIPFALNRAPRFEPPPRPALGGSAATAEWIYSAGSPIWAGPTFASGLVYVGTQDGRILALEARTGRLRWSHPVGGAVRARPTIVGRALYIQADDGYLYRLDAATGEQRWRTRLVPGPIVRLPFDQPQSRYDRFASEVRAVGRRLYVGTHEGRLLALEAADGKPVWEFKAGDAILAGPAVSGARVYFGSYDHHVYALDAGSGRLIWKRDTRGAVVSTPAVAEGIVVVGNRCYDLLGLDARSGEVKWKRYVWLSWIESSATVRNGIAYVGTAEAARVLAVDVRTGRRRWTTDVHGWSWGQPAVHAGTVYAGTSGQAGYPIPLRGAVVALNRSSGTVRWRYDVAPADTGSFGFAGSPAVGDGRVFAAGLDGQVVALPE